MYVLGLLKLAKRAYLSCLNAAFYISDGHCYCTAMFYVCELKIELQYTHVDLLKMHCVHSSLYLNPISFDTNHLL